MNELLTQYENYQEYKKTLDAELTQSAEQFVRIGYLLKVARDTDILRESGYANVTEFAKAEYQLDKTQVSRFISINDRFSVAGYSPKLENNYIGFGYAKLTLMLQLPDAINEELDPSYTKSEIQMIKNEIDEEKKISDLEVLAEDTAEETHEMTLLEKVVWQWGKDDPTLYKDICMDLIGRDVVNQIEMLKDNLIPNDSAIFSVRIAGVGRCMISLAEKENGAITNVRTGEKQEITWQELLNAWLFVLPASNEEDPKAKWSGQYGEAFPELEKTEEKERVAPVQQKKVSVTAKKEPPKTPTKPVITESESISRPVEEKKPEFLEKAMNIPENEQNETENVQDETENAQNIRETTDIVRENEEKSQEVDTAAVEESPEILHGEVIDTVSEVEESASDGSENTLRGYKEAVTNNLNTLQKLWEGSNENKISLMLGVVESMKWKLEEIKRMEDGANG